MASFIASNDDMKNFLNLPSMNDQAGIGFAYATDETLLKKLIPAPLKLLAPVVCGYVVHMGKPTFSAPYLEQSLFALVSYKDKMMGAYPISLLLHGPGAESGVIAGREGAGIPKKLADAIELRRNDNSATATVKRHGKTLLDVSWTAGELNDPSIMQQFAGQLALGKEAEMNSFFYTYDLDQHPDGSNHFTNVELVATQLRSLADQVEPGNLTITMNSTDDDPFGELKVLKPLGAAWFHFDTSVMFNTLKLETVDADVTMPKLLTSRYDRTFFNPKATTYTI
ncbi:acetoacetate decarboxylase [Lactobacillus sp. CBA3605]|uniref:acetoacetate decarboxylase family protein n=1 Tax=Lactobacillus sp. CBA3605 TaxID=2099788 RepID=UPI000CFAA28A|nr:acetoacetate decarboxylase family protein [Lactobacillus sp. CBA3605]AVK61566.1 acetoacetate decarboxylase [Lactobacillus sp. CBA3605]